jgi:hypothetical protein
MTLGGGMLPAEPEQDRAAADAIATFRTSGFGYFLEQATRPQTIGYALLDSPAALAAWMLDHDTDACYKISRAFADGQSSGGLTRDHILDNITVYWLAGAGASTALSYWESRRAQALAAGQAHPEVSLPVGFTTFPARQGRPLRRLGRARAVRDRDPGGVQVTTLTTSRITSEGSRLHTAATTFPPTARHHPASTLRPAQITLFDLHQGQLRSPVRSQCHRRVAALESHRSQAHRPGLRQQIDPGLPSLLRLIMPLWLPSHHSAEPDLLCTGIRQCLSL